MKLLVILLSLLWFSSCHSMPKHQRDYCFSDQALAELDQLCEQIINHFPPDEYFYVGIGRSPTPIIAWLQARTGADSATQIPLSNCHLCKGTDDDDTSSQPIPPSPDNAAKIFRHFDQYLRNEIGSGRKWLVIDTAMSGNTLRSVAYLLKEYLFAHEQPDVSVEMLGITDYLNCEEQEQTADYYTNMGINAAYVSQGYEEDSNGMPVITPLESQLLHGECKNMAPFGKLDLRRIFQDSPPPQPEPANVQAYQYLISRIYFWAGTTASMATWLLVSSVI